MEKIFFENSKLFFQDIFIGIIGEDVEFRSFGNYAVPDEMTTCSFAQVNFPDLTICFTLKEKSDVFQEIIAQSSALKVKFKKTLSDFGTLTIQNADGRSIRIHDVFWTRFPAVEFQLKHNTENTVHSLYFLHNK